MAKFVNPAYDVVDWLSSYFIDRVKMIPIFGEIEVQGEGGKPDLLSYHIYGKTQYWWIILVYNNLLNVEDLKEGMLIKYPSTSQLEELYFQLMSQQTAT